MTATASSLAPSRPTGAPSKFTPENCAAILADLRRGHKRKSACGKVGIAYDTFNKWLGYGRDDPASVYGQFLQEVNAAEQAGIAALVDTWIDQTKTDNRALRSLLAIKDPDEYSEQRQLRVTHSGTVLQVQVQVPVLAISQVAGLLGLAEEPIDVQATDVPDGVHTGTAGL